MKTLTYSNYKSFYILNSENIKNYIYFKRMYTLTLFSTILFLLFLENVLKQMNIVQTLKDKVGLYR